MGDYMKEGIDKATVKRHGQSIIAEVSKALKTSFTVRLNTTP